MSGNQPKLLSGRVKKVPATNADPSRYTWLDLKNAEPDLGVPTSNGSFFVSNTDGTRSWTDTILLTGSGIDIDGELNANSVGIDSTLVIDSANITTTSNTQTQLYSFATATYEMARVIISATSNSERHSTELLVNHNSSNAFATEYATVITNSDLFSVDVDVNASNVRILVTSASSASTTIKAFVNLVTV